MLADTVAGLAQYLSGSQSDCAALFQEQPVAHSGGDHRDCPLVPLANGLRVFEEAARITNRPALGIEYGSALPVGATGPVGFAMVSAPTVRDALLTVTRYLPLISDQQISRYDENAEAGTITWRCPVHSSVPRFQYMSFGAAAVMSRILPAMPTGWKPCILDIDFAAPADETPFLDFFGPAFRSNCPINRFAVDARYLDNPMPDANEHLYTVARRLAELDRQHRGVYASTFEEDARKALANMIDQGQPRLDDLASALGVNTARLTADLRFHGINFKVLLDETRRAAAYKLLRETTTPLTEISLRLGYADSSIFTRACRKWFGQTPSQVRAYGSIVNR
jgi:AraC-like DNA-binding protein